MPAFLAMVEGDEGYVGDVYFTKHAVNARRAVCDEWNDGEFAGSIVRRMRHLDKYEETGWVPMTDMAYEGWWSECYHCGIKLTDSEQYDDDDNEFVLNPEDFVGNFGGTTFCCQTCHDDYFDQSNAKKAYTRMVETRLKLEVEKRFGTKGITFLETSWSNISVRWDSDQKSPRLDKGKVRFDSDRTEYGAMGYAIKNPRANPEEWEFQFSYSRGHTDAVHSFVRERTGLVLDKPESLP